jgi:hypothetical protein
MFTLLKKSVFSRVAVALSILAILVLMPVSLLAQTNTADVVGTVTDPTGAVLPNATVTITNTGTEIARTMQTNVTGDYTFTRLQVGTYKVAVEAQGFKAFVASSLTLGAGDRARVDAKLEIGQLSETVEVEASSAAALHTDSATVSNLITEQSVQEVPLNGRNFFNLVFLSPGVTEGAPNALGDAAKMDDSRMTSYTFAHGQSNTDNNNMIDGMDNNERNNGTIGVRPSIDAIQEVKILTGLYPAEIGRAQGAVIEVITKSGTNAFHGSAYEYLRNDIFDAWGFFDIQKPVLRQNQFGGSLGGPIIKDKTFFFGDGEFFRSARSETQNSQVPPAAAHDDLSGYYGVPESQIDPVAANLFQLFPRPNVEGNPNYNYSSRVVDSQDSDVFDVRIDEHATEKDSIFGRYSYNDVTTVYAGQYPDQMVKTTSGSREMNPGGSNTNYQRQQHFALNYLHTFQPTLLMELKASYMRSATQYLANSGLTAATEMGFPCTPESCINIDIAETGLPSISISTGFGPGLSLGNSPWTPLRLFNNTFQYSGSVTYIRGSHSIKFGMSLVRRQTYRVQPQGTQTGSFSFQNANPSLSIVDFVKGVSSNSGRARDLSGKSYRTWEPSGYVQDDWRVTNWLTLNLGVRYEIYTPLVDSRGFLSNFDPNVGLLVSPILTGIQNSSPTGNVETDYSNIAPRIGFAATLGKGVVLRGGFGMTYFPNTTGNSASMRNAPFEYSYSCGTVGTMGPVFPCQGIFAADAMGNAKLSAGLPPGSFDLALATDPSNYSKGFGLQATELHLRTAYLEQFSLQLEKEIAGNVLSVGWIMDLGRHQQVVNNSNKQPNSSAPFPYPSLPRVTINEVKGAGTSNYSAMQLSFLRRYSKGLTVNANYMWSHLIDNKMRQFNASICVMPGCLVDNVNNPDQPIVVNGWQQYDRGNGDLDVRHKISGMVNYQLPFGKSMQNVAGAIIKDWALNGAVMYQSGMPFTVMQSLVPPQSGLPGGGGPGGGERPNMIGPWKPEKQTIEQWFNPKAFKLNTFGTFGNEMRNQLTGPMQVRLDLSLSREFMLHEQLRLQFRAECFNVTNTPLFGMPSSNIGSYDEEGYPSGAASGGPPGVPGGMGGAGNLGAITSTSNQGYTPREFQFALKLLF